MFPGGSGLEAAKSIASGSTFGKTNGAFAGNSCRVLHQDLVRVGGLRCEPYGGERMLGLRARWILKDDTPPTSGVAGGLRDRLLKFRGGDGSEDPLDVGLTRLEGPEGMPGAEEAGKHIAEALAAGKQIAIHGDYDVDGISASTLLRNVLRSVAPEAKIPIRIPNRLEEGYGLSGEGLLALRSSGIDLVISVDCGVTSIDEIAEANKAGLEMIVTDHHEPLVDSEGTMVLPDAAVVVHPRIAGARGFPDLAGAGVAFKVAWAFAKAHSGSDRVPTVLREALVEALPFAAMGTIADVVPLVGENRVLAAQGLRRMSAAQNVGLLALLRECGAPPEIDEEFIKFQVAPRINALGRLGSAQPALDLFQESDPTKARELARHLSEVNLQRRLAQDQLVEAACARAVQEGQDQPLHPVIVLADPTWKQGLCGPAAAKVAEKFNRPVVLMEVCEDGMARGSARSIHGYSIHDGLASCEAILDRFGGHAAAAGLSIAHDRVELLREGMVQHARSQLDRLSLEATIQVDCRASLWEMGNLQEIRSMRELSPFGHGNPEPKVLVEGVKAIQTRWIGAGGEHLKLVLVSANAERGSKSVDAIWFRASDHKSAIDEALARGPLDLVVEPGINTFNGSTTAQMKIADVRRGL